MSAAKYETFTALTSNSNYTLNPSIELKCVMFKNDGIISFKAGSFFVQFTMKCSNGHVLLGST